MTKKNGNGKANGKNRDEKGYFLPGHSIPGPGNPFAHRREHFNRLIFKHTTDDKILEVWNKIIQQAADGDIHAAKYVLDRVCGKAKENVEVSGDVNLIGSIQAGLSKLQERLNRGEVPSLN